MRKEIEELLETDWSRLPEAVSGLVRQILKLQPTDKERRELAEGLQFCNKRKAYVIIGIMREEPQPLYRESLIKAMNSAESGSVRAIAATTLMDAKYEGAIDAVLASRNVIEALGDEFPREILLVAEDLPQEKQKILLEQFFRRVAEHPPVGAAQAWLKMVSMILIQDKRLTPILWQTWREMPRGQDWLYDRLALLDAMATHPDPIFKQAFERAARSRDDDIKAIGKTGLHVLSEVAAGRWPFDKAAR